MRTNFKCQRLKKEVLVHENLGLKPEDEATLGRHSRTASTGWSQAGGPTDGACVPWSLQPWARFPPFSSPLLLPGPPSGAHTHPVTAVVRPPPRRHGALPPCLAWPIRGPPCPVPPGPAGPHTGRTHPPVTAPPHRPSLYSAGKPVCSLASRDRVSIPFVSQPPPLETSWDSLDSLLS